MLRISFVDVLAPRLAAMRLRHVLRRTAADSCPPPQSAVGKAPMPPVERPRAPAPAAESCARHRTTCNLSGTAQ